MTRLMALAAENGFSHWAAANMEAFVPRTDVRDMCSADRCGKYGASWACPPGCGTLEQAAADIARCSSGLLVQTTGNLDGDFDYEGMQAIAQRHKRSFESFARQARLLYPDCLPLTAGTCTLCARCTYPHKPCRFPSRRLSSMEAYGLWVSDVCRRSGLEYNYGKGTMTYTSCILLRRDQHADSKGNIS